MTQTIGQVLADILADLVTIVLPLIVVTVSIHDTTTSHWLTCTLILLMWLVTYMIGLYKGLKMD